MAEAIVQSKGVDGTPPSDTDFSWRKITAATVCLVGITFGTTYPLLYSLGLVMLPMTHEFGWTRTQFSFAQTFLMGFSVLSMPICGRIADRFGVRPLVILSALALGILSFAMAMQNGDLTLAYIGYAAIGLLGGAGITYAKVVASLFTKHRGKALAIFGAESTLALATIPLLTVFIESRFGWRGVYAGFGVLYLAVIPILYFMLTEPGATTARPTAARAGPGLSTPAPAFAPPPPMAGLTTKQALLDRNFWLLAGAALLGILFYQGISLHLIALLIEKGFSKELATTALSLTMVIGLAGALTGGFMVDHFPNAKIAAPFQLLAALGALALMVVTIKFGGVLLLFVGVGLTGIAMAAQQPMTSYFLTRFFGLRAFNEINAIRTALLAAPLAFSAPLVGFIYDSTHSYRLAFILSIGAAVIGAGLLMLVGRYKFAADNQQAEPALAGGSQPLLPEGVPSPAE